MTDTSGFYKMDLCGVADEQIWLSDGSTMYRSEHDTYTYPMMDGWYWFDSEADAQAHFEGETMNGSISGPDTSGFYLPMLLAGYGDLWLGTGDILYRDLHETYTYPFADGWRWFDSEEQARDFFHLPKPPEYIPPYGAAPVEPAGIVGVMPPLEPLV